MTTEERYEITTVPAAQVFSNDTLWKAATFAGLIAASPNLAVGVIRSTAAIGQGLSCVYDGITKVKVGGAVNTPGFPLTITTSGFFAAAASGGAIVGRAFTTAASGDLVKAMVDFNTISPWAG
jgi:hypothetical protein